MRHKDAKKQLKLKRSRFLKVPVLISKSNIQLVTAKYLDFLKMIS